MQQPEKYGECADCERDLIRSRDWAQIARPLRDQLTLAGYRQAQNTAMCRGCYYADREARSEVTHPAMLRTPLEDVPDHLVHPDHLLVRQLLREARARRKDASCL